MVFYKRETPAANATPRTAQRRASTANEAIERGSNAGRAERWKALKPWSWDGSGRGEERQNGQGGDCEERALLRETGQRVRVCSEQGEDEDEEEEEVEEEVEEAAAAAEEKHQHRDSLRALWALLWLSLAAAAAAAASASSSVPSPASLGGSTVSPLASGTLGTCCCPRDGVSPALFRSLALTRLSLLPLRLPLHSQPVFSSPSPSSSFLLVASKSHFIYFIFSLDPNWLVVPLPYYAYRTGPTLWTRRYHGPPAAFISA
ncbi:hypothetical protein H107_03854 [Trichophyton rubrum CBS 202.88]|nr:hypothetical protein H107_03854 [Trichophyton rubrum CBS 202.88]